jgi:hypothetical protein
MNEFNLDMFMFGVAAGWLSLGMMVIIIKICTVKPKKDKEYENPFDC